MPKHFLSMLASSPGIKVTVLQPLALLLSLSSSKIFHSACFHYSECTDGVWASLCHAWSLPVGLYIRSFLLHSLLHFMSLKYLKGLMIFVLKETLNEFAMIFFFFGFSNFALISKAAHPLDLWLHTCLFYNTSRKAKDTFILFTVLNQGIY